MKGLPYVSRMEHMVNELKENTKHLCGTDQEAHPSIDTEYWIPISPDGIESMMLSLEMDPKSWKEAMASYDVAEWAEGLKEEMDSLQAHKVFTLILKSSVPKGC